MYGITGFPPDVFLTVNLKLDSFKVRTVVKSYNFMELMGDFGGILQIFFLYFAFFGNMLSEKSFEVAKVEANYI